MFILSIYQKNLAIVEKEFVDKKMEMAEYFILGLRLINGISIEDFKRKFNINIKDVYGKIIIKYIDEGLLEEYKGNIRLTKRD